MATKIFDVYIEGKKVATGTIEELMDSFKVSKTAVSFWIKNGKTKDRATPKYKHALLNQEKTNALLQENKKAIKQLPASVYDFYEKEKFIMTGTAREISKQLDLKIKTVFYYVQVGKREHSYRIKRNHAVLNQSETKKRFPNRDVSIEMNEEEEKGYYSLTKEERAERRYKRKLKMKMMIENMQKEELGL
jgi:hypothetical protein